MTYLLMIKAWNQAAGIDKHTQAQRDAASLITNKQWYHVQEVFHRGYYEIVNF
jgi:hypothetical protein